MKQKIKLQQRFKVWAIIQNLQGGKMKMGGMTLRLIRFIEQLVDVVSVIPVVWLDPEASSSSNRTVLLTPAVWSVVLQVAITAWSQSVFISSRLKLLENLKSKHNRFPLTDINSWLLLQGFMSHFPPPLLISPTVFTFHFLADLPSWLFDGWNPGGLERKAEAP